MEKFAGYGFNKSHSAAYALLSYQTAWLKAHYPAAFMAAVLSSDMDQTDKVVTLIDECSRMALDGRAARRQCVAVHVHGVGAAVDPLRARRDQGRGRRPPSRACWRSARRNGAFRDLRDLCRRLDLNRVNRRVLEALIRSGAFDSLAARNRATLMHELPAAMQAADQTLARAGGGPDRPVRPRRAGAGAVRRSGATERDARSRRCPSGARRASRRRARDARVCT